MNYIQWCVSIYLTIGIVHNMINYLIQLRYIYLLHYCPLNYINSSNYIPSINIKINKCIIINCTKNEVEKKSEGDHSVLPSAKWHFT